MKVEKVSAKKTVEMQAAYLCQTCNNQIITIGNLPPVPTQCGNCGSSDIKKLWAQKITTITTVEHL